jgi:RimJ/RimL family protein N-acetyltransferase
MNLTLHTPTKNELEYRIHLLADADTMSYNARWSEDGTGRIFVTEEQVREWHDRISESGMYYAYVMANGQPVGEVNIHKNGEIGVIIEAKHRGKGYGEQALKLLCEKAFCELGMGLLTDDFSAERTAAEQTFASVGFERVSSALVRLTREQYLKIHQGVTMPKFQKFTVCLDMFGCPNRCRHCWVGHAPNARLTGDDLRFVAHVFRPYTNNLEVVSWYREPDYPDNYKELWRLENELSNSRTAPHFELCSVWRAVRDELYVPCLATLGVKICQLTLFGGREKTDYYTGRKGAYDEIVKTINILLANGIAPRLQVFVFRDNCDELQSVVDLIENMRLEERCAAIGTSFTAFVHQGSCDGVNAEQNHLYDLRPTPEDVAKIPQLLIDYSLKHWQKHSILDVFGETEQELYRRLESSVETKNSVSDSPVFYVDAQFNVYPNYSEPSPFWCLGNLKTDGVQRIVDNYTNNRSTAQHTRQTVPIGEMVRKYGDPTGQKLFLQGDYEMYILSRWLENEETK